MKVGRDCIELVKHYEGLGDGDKRKPGLQPYICPAGVATIGYGHVLVHPVTKKQLRVSIFGANTLALAYQEMRRRYGRDHITEDEAEALLEADLNRFAVEVERALGHARTTQKEFDALVSLAFNIGTNNLRGSTVYKRHIQGRREPGNRDLWHLAAQSRLGRITNMSEAFGAWSKSNGKWLAGLFKRRWAEAEVYFGGDARNAILRAEAYRR